MQVYSSLGAIAAACLLSLTVHAEPVDLDTLAGLPKYRSMELSSDGNRIAGILSDSGKEALCIFDLAANSADCLAEVTDLKAGGVRFAGDDFVIMIASKTTDVFGYRGDFEFSSAFSFNLKKPKTQQLLRRTKDLHPAQAGLGRILAVSPTGDYVYMPAFVGRNDNATYSLFRVAMDSGYGRKISNGTRHTLDWFVSKNGDVLAREDFNDDQNEYEIRAFDGNDWKSIYKVDADRPPISLVGLTQDLKHLIFVDDADNGESDALFRMSLDDGSVSGPLLKQAGHEIEGILMDQNRIVLGVRYSGNYPSYGMFDPEQDAFMKHMISGNAGTSLEVDSWSDDFEKVLMHLSGKSVPGNYFLFDRINGGTKHITPSRDGLTSEILGEVSVIKYKARDGLEISALVTTPPGINLTAAKNLPAVILPHGGPAIYDSVQFDYMAQMFATRGYLVLQPNFRGSTGYGREFREAGNGEWGKAMQDDITDGVDAFIEDQLIDPERVCIVGWSYGGYAALMGGAKTPDKYKCVVSIAGVSDLPMMLNETRRDHGSKHWVYDYWTEVIGDVKTQKDELKEISPAYLADQFAAPVLLIHGTDDLTVDDKQSRRMESALKDANKPVELFLLKKQGHSLETQGARVEALSAALEFVNKSIGEE